MIDWIITTAISGEKSKPARSGNRAFIGLRTGATSSPINRVAGVKLFGLSQVSMTWANILIKNILKTRIINFIVLRPMS